MSQMNVALLKQDVFIYIHLVHFVSYIILCLQYSMQVMQCMYNTATVILAHTNLISIKVVNMWSVFDGFVLQQPSTCSGLLPIVNI